MKTVFLFIVFTSCLASSKELVDKIIASISNDVVLLSEAKGFLARIERSGSIDETLLLGDSLDSLKSNSDLQLNYLIREKILESEIRRQGLLAGESQVEAELAQMAKRNRMSAADFSKYLNSQGYSLDDYKKILKTRIERQGFFEREIISKLRITDEDALSFYQTKNPKYRAGIGEFKIAQIFFSFKKGGPESALERARAAISKLSAGEAFESLANQLDETPGSNPDGVLGTFKSGEFIQEIEKSIGDLSENQVSGVIRGPNGYHIVKLLAKKSIIDPEFLKVKEAIKGSLVQQNFERQLKNWFDIKKTDSNLKIYDRAF